MELDNPLRERLSRRDQAMAARKHESPTPQEPLDDPDWFMPPTTPETPISKERVKFPGLKFFATHHPDWPHNRQALTEMYGRLKDSGVDSVRYDWRWKEVEPEAGVPIKEATDRYIQAKENMDAVGLEAPTVILSSPPDWAMQLYKKDKNKFFDAWRSYNHQTVEALKSTGGTQVTRVQMLNELNNRIYTKIKPKDIPKLCDITKEEFGPDTKLVASLLASALPVIGHAPIVGVNRIGKYIRKNADMLKDNFDEVSVDHYPGSWYWSTKDIATSYYGLKGLVQEGEDGKKHLTTENFNPLKAMASSVDRLRSTFNQLADLNIPYSIGEVGIPSNERTGGEKGQRYYYDRLFQSLRRLMVDMHEQGKPVPTQIGIYSAADENAGGKGEKDWGMQRETEEGFEPKRIMQPNTIRSQEPVSSSNPSRLSRIIRYVRGDVSPRTQTPHQEAPIEA